RSSDVSFGDLVTACATSSYARCRCGTGHSRRGLSERVNSRSWPTAAVPYVSPKAGFGRLRLLPRKAAYGLGRELTQPATTGRREACRKADSQRCYQWTPRLVMASMSRSGDVRSLGLVGADRRVLGLPLSTASDLGSLRRLREPRANLVLRRKFLETRFSDVHHHLDDLAGK